MRHYDLIHLDANESKQAIHDPSDSGSCFALLDEQPTPRELEVEHLLCRGYSQENIAAMFGRSVRTISVQASSLYRKRRVHSQVGLLLAYLERNGIFVFGD